MTNLAGDQIAIGRTASGDSQIKDTQVSAGQILLPHKQWQDDKRCLIRARGGKYITRVRDQQFAVANDTWLKNILPCKALFNASSTGQRESFKPRVHHATTAIVDTLSLHAPLPHYEPHIGKLLDNISADLLTGKQFDLDGDGAVAHNELSAAPAAVLNKIPIQKIYDVTRDKALAHLQQKPANPPNIVLIVADDLGYGDVSAFAKDGLVQTPSIDRIASQGAAFTNFHVYPVCSSTRASMLSGQFLRDIRIAGAGGPAKAGVPRSSTLIPEYLSQAGYRTAAFGKWHLSIRPGFLPPDRGFQHWLGFYGGVSPYNFEVINELADEFFFENRAPYHQEKGHVTDLLADRAISFVEQNRDQPFFLYLSFNTVHTPLWGDDYQVFSARQDWLDSVHQRGVQGERTQDYVALVEHMDSRIGDLVARLESLQLTENTLVMFTSDNGSDLSIGEDPNNPTGSNGPFRGGKSSVYEGGLRVPLVAQWPGTIPPGQTVDTFTMLVDLWPTLRDAAGLRATNGDTAAKPGESLLPLVTENGEFNDVDRTGYFHFFIGGAAVIDYPWKLVQTAQSTELFRLDVDPDESRALNDKHPQQLRVLQQKLQAYLSRN